MAALTAPRNTVQQGDLVLVQELGIPVEQATIVHQGGMCGPDAEGYLVPAGVLGAAATLAVASTTGGDGTTYTAVNKGTAGNNIKVSLATPSGATSGATVSTTAGITTIAVTPKSGETNTGLVAALKLIPAVTALVTPSVTAGGTDVVVAAAAAALAGGTGNAYAPSVVCGVAEFDYDNSGNNYLNNLNAGNGTQGAVVAQVKRGCFKFANSTGADLIAQANIFQACYAVDDQTVALTSSSSTRPLAGLVIQVDSDGVWVEINGATVAI